MLSNFLKRTFTGFSLSPSRKQIARPDVFPLSMMGTGSGPVFGAHCASRSSRNQSEMKPFAIRAVKGDKCHVQKVISSFCRRRGWPCDRIGARRVRDQSAPTAASTSASATGRDAEPEHDHNGSAVRRRLSVGRCCDQCQVWRRQRGRRQLTPASAITKVQSAPASPSALALICFQRSTLPAVKRPLDGRSRVNTIRTREASRALAVVREAQKLVGPIQAPWRDRPASRTKIYKTRIPPPSTFANAMSRTPP